MPRDPGVNFEELRPEESPPWNQAPPLRDDPPSFPPPPALPPPLPPPGPWANMSFHPDQHRTRYRLRDRPIMVILRPLGPGRSTGNYLCNRSDILDHLPNTRHFPFGRTFHPHIARRNWTPEAVEALHVLFRGLEAYRNTGTQLYIFERAHSYLDNAFSDIRAYEGCYRLFIGFCTALDNEFGLGCSEELLQQIDDFAIDLMYTHEPGFFNPGRLLGFFMAYSKVFQPTTQRHLETLRELLDSVPVLQRAHLMRTLAIGLDQHQRRSNCNALFRALRDMGFA
ncbi:hypothetical protein F5Y15DRAFT_415206 [Xylariaceae sp. FL0016]|nr:hypothetical protein F5Y15DRAFT_415206 [Xylariaceae sp. FL0016]